MRIKSAGDTTKAYLKSINDVPSAYVAGIDQVTDWQEKAIAGQGLYEEQMRNPDVLARRKVKLAGVSNEAWKSKAKGPGAARIASGMQAGAAKREANFAPFHAELASLELLARTSDPMQNVQNRVGGIAVRLHAKKMELGK